MNIGANLGLPERLRFPERRIATPFGKVGLPNKALLPRIRQVELDDRQRRALLHAIAMDLTMVPALVPWAGDVLAEFLQGLHASELRELMTPEEFAAFTRAYDKISGPKTLGILRTFMEKGSE